MSEILTSANMPNVVARGRGQGRGRSRGRGGLGKYLRARGRGRGRGRPAEFNKRLVLEGEEAAEPGEGDEEQNGETDERARNFGKRQLGSNADRYVEPEPELNSDGEPEIEPDVDLSTFLEKQRLSELPEPTISQTTADDGDDDVDTTLSHILSHKTHGVPSKKGNVMQIEWDDEMDEMSREKAAAEAVWDLKTRFRAKSGPTRGNTNLYGSRSRKQGTSYIEAPPLPLPDGTAEQAHESKDEMQNFLDDLLA